MSTELSRPISLTLCAGLCLALAACGPSQPETSLTRDADAAVTAQFAAGQTLSPVVTKETVGPNFAVLTLPAGARGARLTEKQYPNGWRQSLSLDAARVAGDWNDLSIDIQGAQDRPPETGRPLRSTAARVAKPTQEGVRREILARFPHTPMRIVGRPLHNALGPFGLAVGAGPGDLRCAYAWQWVDNLSAAARGERATFFNSGDTAGSIRLRLCRRGVTADELAALYEGLQIADPAAVVRIAETIRQTDDSRGLGPGALVSRADSLEATLIRAPRARVGNGGGAHGRVARHRRARPEAQEPAVPLTTPASPSADGRQYLAPVDGAGLSAAAPTTRGAGFGPVRLDPGLPAQAYRGPSTARAITPPGAAGAPVYLGQPQ